MLPEEPAPIAQLTLVFAMPRTLRQIAKDTKLSMRVVEKRYKYRCIGCGTVPMTREIFAGTGLCYGCGAQLARNGVVDLGHGWSIQRTSGAR